MGPATRDAEKDRNGNLENWLRSECDARKRNNSARGIVLWAIVIPFGEAHCRLHDR